jgi:SAM-dependent methyltransferase
MSEAEIPVRDRVRRKSSYALAVAGDLARRASARLAEPNPERSLQGDRWVEWSFCFARMTDGPGATMDFGADIGFLSLAAAQRGHQVVAFDRLPSALDYEHPNVRHVQGDALTHDFGVQRFDQILNCSSIEHVGLGGRYGSFDREDGDLDAMAAMRDLLAPGGRMLMTIPVGRDLICAPQHRIYGAQRLPRLTDGYDVAEEQYWVRRGQQWVREDRDSALATEGSERFYSLGLFVLSAG